MSIQAPARKSWHGISADEVAKALETGPQGLSSAEASERLRRYGPNRLRETPPTSPLKLFLDEFRSPLVIILLAAAAVLLAVSFTSPDTDQTVDAYLILGIVFINAVFGFAQNYRAQQGIEALRRMASPIANVLRDRQVTRAEAAALVPGDVVLLEEGDRVPADGRLMEAHDLQVDESALTGESLPVTKSPQPLPDDASLAERVNMAYASTIVLRGRGRLAVTETGMNTEVGRIAHEVQRAEERPTHFQREVAETGKRLTAIIAVIIAAVVVLQLTVGSFSLLETFVAAVALAVAAIPEALPVVITLALAFGTRRMLARKALVRSLPVVEIVGSAQVICTDKTGTITEGRMSLRALHWNGQDLEVTGTVSDSGGSFLESNSPTDQSDNPALLAAGLCNNAQYSPEHGFSGDPTDVALLSGAYKAGVPLGDHTRVDEIPFSSERKMMSVLVEKDGRRTAFTKGAPEVVLQRCDTLHTADGPVPLDARRLETLDQTAERMAGQGLRLIALAYKESGLDSRESIEQGLTFLGLAGMSDPPRAEARQALRTAFDAGIRVVMITGDNRTTAKAIAGEVGLEGDCMEGRELDGLDDEAMVDVVQRVNVFARAEPVHKLRILSALRGLGQVVVMTGDGVNDAPALKGADVGIAMGERGTDVARDASDMVLLDDNFATIVAAVEEGRRIFGNIRKFLNYLLTGNLAEVLVVLIASLAGYLPVTAVQLLWVNLVTDSGPALALGADPAPPGLMRRRPRRGHLMDRPMLVTILSTGSVMAGIVAGSFFAGLALFDLETARTIAFTALVLQQYMRLGVIRFQERLSLLANRWLVVALAFTLALQMALIYTPVRSLFDLVPLGLVAWGILLGGLAAGFAVAVLIGTLVARNTHEEVSPQAGEAR